MSRIEQLVALKAVADELVEVAVTIRAGATTIDDPRGPGWFCETMNLLAARMHEPHRKWGEAELEVLLPLIGIARGSAQIEQVGRIATPTAHALAYELAHFYTHAITMMLMVPMASHPRPNRTAQKKLCRKFVRAIELPDWSEQELKAKIVAESCSAIRFVMRPTGTATNTTRPLHETRVKPLNPTQKAIKEFVQAHPHCTHDEVAAAVHKSKKTICSCPMRRALKQHGVVHQNGHGWSIISAN